MDNDDDLLTVEEVAKILRVDKSFVYRCTQRAEIKHMKLSGNTTRIRRGDVLAFMQSRTVEPAGGVA